jgi:hypothetical protein
LAMLVDWYWPCWLIGIGHVGWLVWSMLVDWYGPCWLIGIGHVTNYFSWNHHFEKFTFATMTWFTGTEYLYHKWPRICSSYQSNHYGCHMLSRNSLPFRSTYVHPFFNVVFVLVFLLFFFFWPLCCLHSFRFTASGYLFGIFNLVLPVSLDCSFLICPFGFSNVYLLDKRLKINI